jgi:hypothetical protein
MYIRTLNLQFAAADKNLCGSEQRGDEKGEDVSGGVRKPYVVPCEDQKDRFEMDRKHFHAVRFD